MRTGQELKKKLGLSKFKYVRIRRLMTASSLPIYQIAFDSRNPQRPLTAFLMTNHPMVPFIVNSDVKRFYATPFVNIENFNGVIENKIFFCHDMSGFFGKRDKYEFFVESEDKSSFLPIYQGPLKEFITLGALRDKQADTTSDLTNRFKQIRKDIQKTANINTKFISSEIAGEDILFKFLTESTEMYGPKHKFAQINFSSKEKEPNPSKTYEIWIKMLNVLGENGWISSFDVNAEVLAPKDVKDLIRVSNCQIWSNDPSFQYQGMNWALTQLDASLNPEDRPPNVWGPRHGGSGNYFLTKHLSQLIDQLPFFLNIMASSLSKLLKDKGHIPRNVTI